MLESLPSLISGHTYMMTDLCKWIQDLSLHSLPSILSCRHHEFGQSFLQKSFTLGSRGGLNELLLSQNVRNLDDRLPVAIYIGLELCQTGTIFDSLRSFCVNVDALCGNPSSRITFNALLSRTTVFTSRRIFISSGSSRHW